MLAKISVWHGGGKTIKAKVAEQLSANDSYRDIYKLMKYESVFFFGNNVVACRLKQMSCATLDLKMVQTQQSCHNFKKDDKSKKVQ